MSSSPAFRSIDDASNILAFKPESESARKVLEVRSLGKSYVAGNPILDNINFSLHKGELLGVIGRSGAGKSTLLQLLNGTHPVSEGKIIEYSDSGATCEVSALRGHSLKQWRSRCGMIFQDFCLVPRLDVLTNVLMGRLSHTPFIASMFKVFKEEDRAQAISLLEWIGLLPQALQRAEKLSGGQMQRVAICRALMQSPSILLADEPVASLDPGNTTRIMNALKDVSEQGISVVVNLHSIELVQRYCTRVIGLAKGKVIYDGLPENLSEAVLEQLYQDEPRDAGMQD